jgi:hypothetical protein
LSDRVIPPYCAFPRELVRLLTPLVAAAPDGDARLGRARADASALAIAYPVGSGAAEQIAFFAGFKPLMRQLLRPDDFARTRQRYIDLGLVVEHADHLIPAGPEAVGQVLFVGRDAERVRAAVRCEARMNHGIELGRLLGYPACCIAFYEDMPLPRRNAYVHGRALARTEGRPEPRLNVLDLTLFHYVPWMPCSFTCAPSLAFANAVAMHLGKLHARVLPGHARRPCAPGCAHQQFVAQVDRALAAHRLVAMEGVQVSMDGVWDGARLQVERAWPTARDRHPGVPLDADEKEAAALLAALLEAEGVVHVDDGVLVVGGRRLVRTDDLLLAPFGRRS